MKSMVKETLGEAGSSSGKVMVERCDLLSSAKLVELHDWSLLFWLTVILELSSLSSSVFRTISLVGLTSSPSMLHRSQRTVFAQHLNRDRSGTPVKPPTTT